MSVELIKTLKPFERRLLETSHHLYITYTSLITNTPPIHHLHITYTPPAHYLQINPHTTLPPTHYPCTTYKLPTLKSNAHNLDKIIAPPCLLLNVTCTLHLQVLGLPQLMEEDGHEICRGTTGSYIYERADSCLVNTRYYQGLCRGLYLSC